MKIFIAPVSFLLCILFLILTCHHLSKSRQPFPDVFLEICKAFDVKPEETLVLEDSANGVQAALAGNLPVINIPDLLPIPKEQQEKCVAVVENLKEVIPYI